VAAQHEVFVLASEAVELSPGIAVLAAEPEVVFVAVASVAVVSLAGVAEPQASVDIHVVFVVLVPVSAALVEVDSSEHPTFVAFPNVDCCATSASSVEVVGDQSVRNATDAHTSYDLCSILSTLGLHHNKNLEHSCNNPSPGYNTVSDTNDLAMDATTNHSRKTNQRLFQEQRIHRAYQVALSQLEVRQTRQAAVSQY
jgi:hypothetical protein